MGYRGLASASLSGESCGQRLPEYDTEELQDKKAHSELYRRRTFPCFFTPELSQALIRARQSLDLLGVARPTHEALLNIIGTKDRRKIGWIWTEEEINHAWQSTTPSCPRSPDPTAHTVESTGTDIKDDGFQLFQLFDEEPGTHLSTLHQTTGFSVDTGFEAFLRSFPQSLPSMTPSLPHLAELVLSPLSSHASTLSAALVKVFLSPDGYFSFHAHMALLRSYILLTSQAFKSRLQSALFSNIFDPNMGDIYISTVPTGGPRPSSQTVEHPNRFVIGLAPSLTEGEWPPAGGDLRYQLRTVIIDSLDIDHPDRQLSQQVVSTVHNAALIYDEAEWRLGFAIRDLPTGSGHAKWLNPRCECLGMMFRQWS